MTSTVITTRLPKFAKVIDGVLPTSVCEGLIDHFKISEETVDIDAGGYPTFTQLIINVHLPEFVQPLVHYTRQAVKSYRQCYGMYSNYIPEMKSLEEFRIKRYNSDTEDRFDTHVDVADKESAPRYLALLFYLNDDFTGGETSFLDHDMVKPRQGSVLIFPPYWQFPHAGLPVRTGTKYIMSTYLHHT